MQKNTVNPFVSVDCVILGFDGVQLNALLLKRTGKEGAESFNDFKLPGSLIYSDENLDEAAQRVMGELFAANSIYLRQFRCFGSPERTGNPRDVHWLENAVKLKIGRIVTVCYLSLIRIDDKLKFRSDQVQAVWTPMSEIPKLAFDHNRILEEALTEVRNFVTMNPDLVFNLLPKKFTAAQIRTLFEQISRQKMDVRNFHKKMSRMNYVVALEEFEKDVAHRSARYYRFDRKMYQKYHGGFNKII